MNIQLYKAKKKCWQLCRAIHTKGRMSQFIRLINKTKYRETGCYPYKSIIEKSLWAQSEGSYFYPKTLRHNDTNVQLILNQQFSCENLNKRKCYIFWVTLVWYQIPETKLFKCGKLMHILNNYKFLVFVQTNQVYLTNL